MAVCYGPLLEGQQQAFDDLLSIARRSDGALAVAPDRVLVDGVLNVHVDLSTASLRSSSQGLALQEWEPIDLKVYQDFPLGPPIAWAGRDDFPELPHQAEGSGFCLRVEPGNWDHRAGMAGFMRAVIDTYERIALGTLEGHLQPWRPLAGYSRPGCAVVKADPDIDGHRTETMFCWALAVPVGEDRIDVLEWVRFDGDTSSSWAPSDVLEDIVEQIRATHSDAFLVPAVIIPKPVAMEYCKTWGHVAARLERHGVSAPIFLAELARVISITQRSAGEEPGSEITIGALLFRVAADTDTGRQDQDARCAVARFCPAEAELFSAVSSPAGPEEARVQSIHDFFSGQVPWIQVYDGRPDSVRRRAAGRPTERLAKAKIMVLGAGGLGAPIAEHCVRAGAAAVYIVDSGRVTPGILSRQPYEDADIGKFKAEVLASRLGRISGQTDVIGLAADVIYTGLAVVSGLAQFDLIIDATANQSVAAMIERSQQEDRTRWPALVTVAISQQATHGVAGVTPRGAVGAGVDLLRRLGLETSAKEALRDVFTEFFQPLDGGLNFHPDTSCSDPTFIGSATDTAALAAQLLDGAASHLDLHPSQPDSVTPHRSLIVVRRPDGDDQRQARGVLDLPPDHVVRDQRRNYEVRVDENALRAIHRYSAASASGRTPGGGRTGGLLLGQFDSACRIGWISCATSLPPDSTVDPFNFRLDVKQVRDYLSNASEQCGGLLGLIGFWQAHPGSPARPSEADRRFVQQLLDREQWQASQALLLDLQLPSATAGDEPARTSMPGLYAEILTK